METKITLKIAGSIKDRLRARKGNISYEKYIDFMLSYFEMTGIDPTVQLLPPEASIINSLSKSHDVLYKRIEDLIKIIRSVELNKIDVILETLTAPVKSVEIQKVQEQMMQLYEAHQKVIGENNRLLEINEKQYDSMKRIPNIIRSVFSAKYLQIDKEGNYLINEDKVNELITSISKLCENVQ